MIRKPLILTALSAAMMLTAPATGARTAAPGDIIPRPASVTLTGGAIAIPEGFDPESAPARVKGKSGEGYKLTINRRGIKIEADGPEGAFYARQTLRAMAALPGADSLACCTVTDSPRFKWRGMHFDVSRHFRSLDWLKKQVDAMAMLKLNRMHLHLTDAAGWRMEIDSFPRLASFAAWRPQHRWTDWNTSGQRYCHSTMPGAYGGFYTKAQLRELVDYAARRGITVIPEIEMPGHSEEVTAAYPEVSCTGEPYTSGSLCPGKEATFDMLEKVIDEVIDVFPSELIHIGGDEVDKTVWSNCPDCRRRMEAEGIADVDGLQSYLIARMERYINSRGRSIIGWDEILQGGVAPNAAVMSWRGTEGGISAMSQGHDVVMAPGASCYINHSQDAPFREPESQGGYLPLAKVYAYEPLADVPDSLDTSHLLGLQGCLWTEYIPTDDYAEYMYYPRAFAIAETGWSPRGKDYPDFRRRALELCGVMRAGGYTTFDLAAEYGERPESLEPLDHAARGARVIYTTPYHWQYPAAAETSLTDGIRGGWTYGDNRWQGFLRDMDLTIDLGEVKPIHYMGATFMHSEGAWVHLPQDVTWEVSVDGVNFTPAGVAHCDLASDYQRVAFKEYGVVVPGGTRGRYVRLKARRNPRPGCWLFTDEIVVN